MTHEFRPTPGRISPRFSGIKTFMRLPFHEDPNDVDAMILGIPYDGLTSYRPGARFGPTALREATSLARAYHWEAEASIFDSMKTCDGGDVLVNVYDAKETFAHIEKKIAQLLSAECIPICIGGDHSVTLPILRAFKKATKKPVSLFHVDAHADSYGPAWGVDIHHGTFIRHAVKEGLISPEKTFQVGLRGPLAEAVDATWGEEKGIQVVKALDLHKNWANFEKAATSWKKKVGQGPVYVTFDIDGMDPAFAPGTGTPVPGGLASWQALSILQTLQGINFVGGDLVEIAPMYDPAGITQTLGMSVVFELLSLAAHRKNGS